MDVDIPTHLEGYLFFNALTKVPPNHIHRPYLAFLKTMNLTKSLKEKTKFYKVSYFSICGHMTKFGGHAEKRPVQDLIPFRR